jgi:hypothetical protein
MEGLGAERRIICSLCHRPISFQMALLDAGLPPCPRCAIRQLRPPTPEEEAAFAARHARAALVLVGCGSRKRAYRAPARELYTGSLFALARRRAIDSGKPWYILSALHGLVHPDEVLAPYDARLPEVHPRRGPLPASLHWAQGVIAALAELAPPGGLDLEVLAGRAYVAPLRAEAPRSWLIREPLAGLGIGKRLAALSHSP